MKRASSMIITLVLLLGGVGQAKAGLIFTNLGPGNSYNTTSSWSVGGSSFGVLVAVEFMPTTTSRFQDAVMPLGNEGTSGPAHVLVSLMANQGGSPGAILEQLTVSVSAPASAGGALTTAASVQHPTLTAGTPYWLVLSEPTQGETVGWFWNSTGDVGVGGNFQTNPFGSLSGPWFHQDQATRPAFQIDGPRAVPDPSDLTLLATATLSLAGYFGWRRARRRVAA
ncbi:MAG TPA: choice-of-anchor R domain-containing protein [Gemmataceae bacterium]|nr:choice-of-anchor R domain-containing protein [Gemmataceae bacterium]